MSGSTGDSGKPFAKLSLTAEFCGFLVIIFVFSTVVVPVLGQYRASTGMDFYIGRFNLVAFWDLSHLFKEQPWIFGAALVVIGVLEWRGRLRLSASRATVVRLGLALLVAIFIGGHCFKDWLMMAVR